MAVVLLIFCHVSNDLIEQSRMGSGQGLSFIFLVPHCGISCSFWWQFCLIHRPHNLARPKLKAQRHKKSYRRIYCDCCCPTWVKHTSSQLPVIVVWSYSLRTIRMGWGGVCVSKVFKEEKFHNRPSTTIKKRIEVHNTSYSLSKHSKNSIRFHHSNS